MPLERGNVFLGILLDFRDVVSRMGVFVRFDLYLRCDDDSPRFRLLSDTRLDLLCACLVDSYCGFKRLIRFPRFLLDSYRALRRNDVHHVNMIPWERT